MSRETEPSPREFWQTLGPGLITGAADDDPSGIATYSQSGAQFGFGMLWVMLLTYPLMAGIQEVCADIGRVSGRGLAGNLRRHYPMWLTVLLVATLVIANTLNLGADVGAMGDAASLLVPGHPLVFGAFFAVLSLTLQIFVPYHRYVFYLKWLTIALFAYVGTAMVVHVNWPAALTHTVLPDFQAKAPYLTALVGVLGTTISPYLFFWQASEEVEEERRHPSERPLKRAPEQAAYQLRRIRTDTFVGMFYSNLIAWFIILAVAVTLNARHITDINSSSQAAQALKPVAGKFAFLLFTVGILGTGLLAVPVLAGSAAYAVGELLAWPVGLERKPLHARGFYGVIAIATLAGLALNFAHVNAIKALFWCAVINGVAAGPLMIATMFMSRNKKVMGQFRLSARKQVLGWTATILMLVCAVLMFVFWNQQ